MQMRTAKIPPKTMQIRTAKIPDQITSHLQLPQTENVLYQNRLFRLSVAGDGVDSDGECKGRQREYAESNARHLHYITTARHTMNFPKLKMYYITTDCSD